MDTKRVTARLPKAQALRERRLFAVLALLLLASAPSFSQVANVPPGGNAFGGPESVPPPTAEEDDFIDPSSNMGFPAPPPPNSAPGSVGSSAPPPPIEDSPATRPSRMASPSNRPMPTPTAPTAGALNGTPGATASNSKSGKKEKIKLADYLELDSSVKALEVKNFDLPDKEIRDVVTLISKWTGKNFILDSKVRGKITILGPSPVTLEEAYQAFLSSLEANNLTTIQSGKFIRIIESAEARRSPVQTYAGEYAPATDQFITRIFQLQYINADEVQREFRDLTSRQGKLFAYEPTNSIIITDTGSNIARIQEILGTLDVKGFETTLHVLRIRNTSSKAISEMLGEIYGEGQGAGRSTGAPRTFRRSSLERTRGGGIISKIIPDEQTNSLVVLANQAGFEQLKRLVAKLDVKVTDTGRIHVYYCEYAKAEDLASTLAALSGTGAGNGRSGSRTNSVTSPNMAGGTTGAQPQRAGAMGPVTAELEGGVRITSDTATNSLVVTANSGDYQTLKRVIKKLDIPRLQVFVETAILEVAVDKTTSVGNNFGLGSNRGLMGSFISDSQTVTSFLSGVPQEGTSIPIFAGQIFSAPNPAGGNPIQMTGFMGFLKFLTSNTNTSVLSTPQIIALDNEKAEFKVLDETPVQTTFTAGLSQNAGLSGVAQGSIERLKTGIQIKLTPHVNAASRSIRLELEQQVDSTKASSSVPLSLRGVQVATTSRVTNTSVVVKDQNYIMLGGLMQDKVDESIKKVPLLGDIPILGWLFKARNYQVVKTNLIILLRPRIISTSVAAANVIQERVEKRAKFIDENLGDSDPHEDRVKEMKQSIQQQREGKDFDPIDRYRNNNEDDPDAESVTHVRPHHSDAVSTDPGESQLSAKKTEKKTKAPTTPPVGDKTASVPLLPGADADSAPAPNPEFVVPPTGSESSP